jgi:hypothetical protein
MKPTETASAYPLNLRCVLLISLVAALGGLLFVYDTAVVSDAIGFLKKHFNCPANAGGWAASSTPEGRMFGGLLLLVPECPR